MRERYNLSVVTSIIRTILKLSFKFISNSFIFKEIDPHTKVSECLSAFVFAVEDLDNRWTDMVLLDSEAP